jgi:anti-anti-sigma factor
MQLHLSHEDGYVLGVVHGPIDESAGAVFRMLLSPLLDVHGTKVVLDLSDCQRINSAGIGYLVNIVARANTNSSKVVLISVPPLLQGVFSVTRLDKLLVIVNDLGAALTRLSSPDLSGGHDLRRLQK